ncbi:MAG: hypothetical protein LBV34_23570, partial [Nocardiopsaceae bacterium]|nr:hypothetical protein [Nocardiopsaceae bacterium]
MNRPTEQLIRDYLNRLSLAAKFGLEPGDRQALLDHTRARIDAECGGAANPTAEHVRRTLAGLGDPVALVEKERSRVAARRAWDKDEAPRAATGGPEQAAGASRAADSLAADSRASDSRAVGSQRQVWPPPATPAIGHRPLMPPVIMPAATANAQGWAVRLTTTTPSAPGGQPVLAGSNRTGGVGALASRVPASRPRPASEDAIVRPLSASNGAWAGPPVSPDQVSQDQDVSAANGSSSERNESSGMSAAEAGDSAGRPKDAGPTSPPSPRGVPPAKEAGVPQEVPADDDSPAADCEPVPAGSAGKGEGGKTRGSGLSARLRPRWPGSGSASTTNAARKRAAEREPAAVDKPPSLTAAGRKAGDHEDAGLEFSIDHAEMELKPTRLEVGLGWLAMIGAAVARLLKRVGAALLTVAQRDRLEAVAIVLLGLGGAIYQPIWLIGAFVAVASK